MELASVLLNNEGYQEKNHKSDGRDDGRRPTNHPSLQLELKLSWPNDISQGDKACSSGALVDYDESGPSSSSHSRSMAAEEASWRCRNDDKDGERKRLNKKLRLSKEQACFLEESFKENTTLNPKQKQAIAKRLGLRPRQVEVWFQNRRARTKLKQTEVDCEYLKQYCEFLAQENRRLHKEIQELRSLQPPSQHPRLHGHAATLSMCPSCEHSGRSASNHKREGFVAPVAFKQI